MSMHLRGRDEASALQPLKQRQVGQPLRMYSESLTVEGCKSQDRYMLPWASNLDYTFRGSLEISLDGS